eukprot:147635_1
MGNFYTLNSMVILIFTEFTSNRSYHVIYSFSWWKSAVSMNIGNKMEQIPHKITPNVILCTDQHHWEMKTAITFSCNSKMDHKCRSDSCFTNFILTSYDTFIPLYTRANATNEEVNMKYCCFYHVFILFRLVSSILFGQKLCSFFFYLQNLLLNIMRIFVRNDRFVMAINSSKSN